MPCSQKCEEDALNRPAFYQEVIPTETDAPFGAMPDFGNLLRRAAGLVNDRQFV
jgi:hypothetical protein